MGDSQPGGEVDVVSVGEVLVDMIAPEAPDLEMAQTFVRAAGGAPANVAVAAARLGARTGLVSAVGDDPFGAFLLDVLGAEGVDVTGVRVVRERTTLAFVARNVGGIPDFVFFRGADAVLRAEDVAASLQRAVRIVHLSSMALLSEPSRGATLSAARIAGRSGVLVSVDPNLRPSSWPSLEEARRQIGALLEHARIVKVNDEEAALLTGSSGEAALDALAAPGRLVVMTRGADGCFWRWKDASGSVEAPPVEVVDTTGAGDAFTGALLAELSRLEYRAGSLNDLGPSTLKGILGFACAAGAIACTAPGAMTSLPGRDQVMSLLRASRAG